ncbi:MAG TPA: PilT/PilU family type 4a pilus ATPase [Acidimicrobiales bacterium]|jgi:twitching motility protein PilT|nr:PilT/PilU family type 4a pilus ATPase [Acidimicrobiales bacterium]
MQHHEALELFLRTVVKVNGTDMLLTAGSGPLIRVDGALRPVAGQTPLDEDMMGQLLQALLDKEQLHQLEADRDLDFAFSYGPARFRGNAFFQRGQPAVALRLMHNRIPSFDETGMPVPVQRLIALKQGLILFTGPTGSGKSTSMATLVDAVNVTRACHIITLEDPIEYLHENKTAVVNQREIGIDALSFERALRSALREDPDVVLVGEMRDPESIAITLTLAETGHLVLSSLHTNDAPQALDRIVDVFPADRQSQIRLQLSSVLSAVVAQRLVPRIGGGLVAAYEVLIATSAVSNLVREGKTRQLRNAMQMGQADGNITLEMSLNHLVASGIISHETAMAYAFVPHEIAPPPPPPLPPPR